MAKNNRLQKAKLLVGDNEVMTASPYTLRRYMARNHSYNGDVDGKLHTINGREYVQNASGMLFPLSRTSIPYSGTGKLTSVGYRSGDPINVSQYRGVKTNGVIVRPPAQNKRTPEVPRPYLNTPMRTTSGAYTPDERSVLDLINQNAGTRGHELNVVKLPPTARRAEPRNFSRNSTFTRPTSLTERFNGTKRWNDMLEVEDSYLDEKTNPDYVSHPITSRNPTAYFPDETAKPLHGPWLNTEDYATQEWNNGWRKYVEGRERVRGVSSPTAYTPDESGVIDSINGNSRRRIGQRSAPRTRAFASNRRQTNSQMLGGLLDQPLKGSASSVVGSANFDNTPITQRIRRSINAFVAPKPTDTYVIRDTLNNLLRGKAKPRITPTVAGVGGKAKPRIAPTVAGAGGRASGSSLGRKTMRVAGKVWGKLPWWAKLGVGVGVGTGLAYGVDQTVGRILPRKQQAPPPTPTAELGKRMGKSMTKSMTTLKTTIKHNNKYF